MDFGSGTSLTYHNLEEGKTRLLGTAQEKEGDVQANAKVSKLFLNSSEENTNDPTAWVTRGKKKKRRKEKCCDCGILNLLFRGFS